MQNNSSARLNTIARLCSFLTLLYSPSMLVPVAIGYIYNEADLSAFIFAFFLAFFLGVVGITATTKNNVDLQTKDGFLVAVLFWIIFSIVSTTPFALDQRLNLSLIDATFEAISGITTTGATILIGIDDMPHSVLYYRAQLNFLGGLGIIVLAVAVLPLLGIGGVKLYQSEMPGPFKEEKLTPRLTDTAKQLWYIYLALVVICTLSFFIAGMNFFDALCHGFSTISLGGFSTKGDSLSFYNSYAIEMVGGVFSILSAVSFSLYFAAIYRRSISIILKNSEFQFFILIASIVIFLTCLELWRVADFSVLDAGVHGFFQAASMITDNGLSVSSYPNWPEHVVLLLLGASFLGGCVGSTCGGIKAIRFLILYRGSFQEISKLLHPNALLAAKIGKKAISDRIRLRRNRRHFCSTY